MHKELMFIILSAQIHVNSKQLTYCRCGAVQPFRMSMRKNARRNRETQYIRTHPNFLHANGAQIGADYFDFRSDMRHVHCCNQFWFASHSILFIFKICCTREVNDFCLWESYFTFGRRIAGCINFHFVCQTSEGYLGILYVKYKWIVFWRHRHLLQIVNLQGIMFGHFHNSAIYIICGFFSILLWGQSSFYATSRGQIIDEHASTISIASGECPIVSGTWTHRLLSDDFGWWTNQIEFENQRLSNRSELSSGNARGKSDTQSANDIHLFSML